MMNHPIRALAMLVTMGALAVALPAWSQGRGERGGPGRLGFSRPMAPRLSHSRGLLGELIFPCQAACTADAGTCQDTAKTTALSCISSACSTEIQTAQTGCATDRSSDACTEAVDALAECADSCLATFSTAVNACRSTLSDCRDTCAANQ